MDERRGKNANGPPDTTNELSKSDNTRYCLSLITTGKGKRFI